MNRTDLTRLLEKVASGSIDVPRATETLFNLPYEDIGFACVDHHRSLRKGFPEVIYGEGKTAEQIQGILEKMIPREKVILVTRIDPAKAARVTAAISHATYHADARMLIWEKEKPIPSGRGKVLIISAGTSDIPVAREAALTAEMMGNPVDTLFDVGVAGIHRLLGHRPQIQAASVLVVVAGMEGALPGIVAGMVARPVIAVPTSVGYGTSLGGLAALFAMLNSCSANVAVMNIDNGFGAGYMAAMINRK